MKWYSWLKTLAPIIFAMVPQTQAIAGRISDAIGQAEEIPGATGVEKKAHVMQITADAIAAVNTVAGSEKLPPVETLAVASSVIDTVVSVINALDKVKTPAVPPTA